jgi:starch phosphorylase
VEKIPAEELWRTHERRRERLVAFARRRLREQLQRRGAPQAEIDRAGEVLDPEALTIGFARRFATYKRATLLLRDPVRLARILNDVGSPVQIIYAGKAHPRDDGGKDLIRQIVTLAAQKEFRRRLVFLEDYDMAVSRYLVQGCDVWLNTPRRPLEASGTSGMKAAANGALNLSTLDGWWDEAWRDSESDGDMIGWAIGRGEQYSSPDEEDRVEAETLYGLLERDVVPAFYDRGPDRLPQRWIAHMRASLGKLCHVYNTHRMVREYTERFYLIADARLRALEAESAQRARKLGAWLERVRQGWAGVRVELLGGDAEASIQVGETIQVRARIRLGILSPADVSVELYQGRVDAHGELVAPVAAGMQCTGPEPGGSWIFEASVRPCRHSGEHGYTVRVLPCHSDLSIPFVPGLIAWAEPGTSRAQA